MTTDKIGFIGQGWIGKHYANDLENREYITVRYALEEPYCKNKEQLKECSIIFIAVPTPTTEDGFDDSAVIDALGLIPDGATAVIKSTITVGTTKRLQKQFPLITVLHSPEFLAEKTAAYDAAHPNRNLIGVPDESVDTRKKAQQVLDVLPDAPYQHIMDSNDAELVKYAGNCFLYTKVLFMNILYDLVQAVDGDWDRVRDALVHDPRIGLSHTQPLHRSGHANDNDKPLRGAGGHCFIKDFETFRGMYNEFVQDDVGGTLLKAQSMFNLKLLVESNKDIDLVQGVYGDIEQYKKPMC